MDRTISQTFKVAGVLTDVTSAKLSDPTGTFGIKRNDTDEVVVADGTDMTRVSTGTYEYVLDAELNVSYTAYIEFVYLTDTIYIAFDLPAVSDEFGMVASYNSLVSRIGKYLFGIRSGFLTEQANEINDCIHDGLNDVYTAHSWSFFRPNEEITTTAPYATGTVTVAAGVVTLVGGTWPSWAASGVLKLSNNYYSVDTRNSASQITLQDTSLTQASSSGFQLGRPEYDLPDGFEAISADSELNYDSSQSLLFPPVCQRSDRTVRRLQQDDPFYWHPRYYSVRTVEFDSTIGSRKRLCLYPTPDAAYVLRVPMILRPIMIDALHPYPVGGETLAQVILEACLAAAERNFDEQNKRHTERFMQLLPLAIAADMEKSSPTSLGPDGSRRRWGNWVSCDYDYWARSARIGSLTLDNDTL